MKYRKLGNAGLIVSEVALGTMQFGGKNRIPGIATCAACVAALVTDSVTTRNLYGYGERRGRRKGREFRQHRGQSSQLVC